MVVGVLLVTMAGCRGDAEVRRPIGDTPRQMDRPSQTITIETQADRLTGLVADVQAAPTPQAEADALRRLRKYEADNGLTYTIRTFRTYDNLPLDDPSVRPDPVRAEVTIFRGRETVKTFHFVPKDNRNLALMGE